MNRIRQILTLVVSLGAVSASAVEILDASVAKRDGIYYVAGSSVVHAPAEFIFDTLIDFDNFHKIAGGITETRFVDGDVPGERLGYTRIESCVLFFCRSAEKLERIESAPHREIRTRAIPEASDFELNNARWTLVPEGEATRLTYEAEFRPKFWLPPLISTWAIKRKLVESAETIGLRIEYLHRNGLTLAQIREPERE